MYIHTKTWIDLCIKNPFTCPHLTAVALKSLIPVFTLIAVCALIQCSKCVTFIAA